MRTMRTASEAATRARPIASPLDSGFGAFFFLSIILPEYQAPTLARTTIPTKARVVNQIRLDRPLIEMMVAAKSGPSEEPVLPPTWKNDWANPRRLPAAIEAIREASGWKIDEPSPTRHTETS